MKKLKFILIAFFGVLLISSASFAQQPTVSMRYHVEIFDSPAKKVWMSVQVWIPNQPATIQDALMITLEPGLAQSAHEYDTYYGPLYDIYSVQIYDNTGGTNHAYIGGNYPNFGDFAYKPFSGGTTYIYDAIFYPLNAHYAGVTLD